MKLRYTRPAMINLNTAAPTAEGLCGLGSWALGGLPKAHCFGGGSASGAYCMEGVAPGVNGCLAGNHPNYVGCQAGQLAQTTCSLGNNVF